MNLLRAILSMRKTVEIWPEEEVSQNRACQGSCPQRVLTIFSINSQTLMRCRSLPSGTGGAEVFWRKKIFKSQMNINPRPEMIQIITCGSSKAGTIIKGMNKGWKIGSLVMQQANTCSILLAMTFRNLANNSPALIPEKSIPMYGAINRSDLCTWCSELQGHVVWDKLDVKCDKLLDLSFLIITPW